MVRRIQVVFSRVIDDSEVTFLSGGLVRQDLIDLARLQIVAALVPHTQDKCWLGFSPSHEFLTQEAFNLESLLPDSMRFVPVNLGSSDSAIDQTNGCNPFTLAPAPSSIPFTEACAVSDAPADRDGLNLSDLPISSKYIV
jgi:hypothetical protein